MNRTENAVRSGALSNLVEFPGPRKAPVQPRCTPPRKKDDIQEFLDIVSNTEFQKAVGRILAADVFGANPDMLFTAHATRKETGADAWLGIAGAYRKCANIEAGRIFDFLRESAGLDQQFDLQRRKFSQSVAAAAVETMQQLLSQGQGWRSELGPLRATNEALETFRHRKRALRQVSRGVEPKLAFKRARNAMEYRKWVLSTNFGVKSANEAEALLVGGLVNYKQYKDNQQVPSYA